MKRPFFAYILALLLFGTNGVVASYISLSSTEIVLLRTLIGGLFLAIVFFATKGKLTFYHHKKQFAFLCVSGISMGVSWMLLYEAYSHLGVSMASLLFYCGPVVVMVVSPILFKETLTVAKILGFLAVLCGVFLVNGQAIKTGGSQWGIFCGLMSALAYAILVVSNKKAKEITGLENAVLQLLLALLVVAVFVGVKQGLALHIAPASVFPILLLGLLNTGVGCYLYFSSIGKLPVQTVAIFGYVEPLSVLIFSFLFLGETLLPLQILGAAFILGGAIFGECWGRRPTRGPMKQ